MMKCGTICVATLLCVALSQAASTPYVCENNPNVDTNNKGMEIFNGCYRDHSKYEFPGHFSSQLISWFQTDNYLQYILVIIAIIPVVALGLESQSRDGGSGGNTLETAMERSARTNCRRLNAVLLLFRVALAGSMDAWLQAAIQQERPCACYVEILNVKSPANILGNGIWGMPSGDSMTATVLAMHILEYASIPLGIFFLPLVPIARVILGYHSIGQVLAGIGFGLVIHFYTTRTPIYARFVDVLLNFVAGTIVFFVARHNHPTVDFSTSVGFFTGAAWQIFACLLLFVVYDWSFMKPTLFKTVNSIDVPDFLYYMPLNSSSDDEFSSGPSANGSVGLFIVCVVSLYVSLSCIQVFAPYFGETMSDIMKI